MKMIIVGFFFIFLSTQLLAVERDVKSSTPLIKIHYESYRLLADADAGADAGSGHISAVIVFNPDVTILYNHGLDDTSELSQGHLDACAYLQPGSINDLRRAGVAQAQLLDRINRAPPEEVNTETARKLAGIARVFVALAGSIENKPVAVCYSKDMIDAAMKRARP